MRLLSKKSETELSLAVLATELVAAKAQIELLTARLDRTEAKLPSAPAESASDYRPGMYL